MRYLSDQWLAAADQALRARADAVPAGDLVIDQHIAEKASYRITVSGDQTSLSRIDASTATPGAHVVFRQSASTARAVAQGTTDAHQAFLLGQIRFEGDIEALINHRDALNWIEQTLAPLLEVTTFD